LHFREGPLRCRAAVDGKDDVLHAQAGIGGGRIGTHFHDPRLSVMLLGCATGLMWLGFLAYLLVLSGNSLSHAIRRFAIEAVIAVALAAPITLAALAHASPYVVTGLAGVMGLVTLALIVRRVPGLMGRPG